MGAHFFWSSINFNGTVYLGYWPRHEPNQFIWINGAQFGIPVTPMNTSQVAYMDYNFGGVIALELEETK